MGSFVYSKTNIQIDALSAASEHLGDNIVVQNNLKKNKDKTIRRVD